MPGEDEYELDPALLNDDDEMGEVEHTAPQNQGGAVPPSNPQQNGGNPAGAGAMPPAPASAPQAGQQATGQPQGGTTTQQQPVGQAAPEGGRHGAGSALSGGRGRGTTASRGRGSGGRFQPYPRRPAWYLVANLRDPRSAVGREQLRADFHDLHPCQESTHIWHGRPPLHTNRECGHQRWRLALPAQSADTLVLCSPPAAGAGPSAGPLAPVAQPMRGPAYVAQPSTQQVLGVSNVVQTPGSTTVVVNTVDATPILAALQQGMYGAPH